MSIETLPLTGEIKGPMEFQREVDRVLQGIKFKSWKPDSPHWRPGTEIPCTIRNYWMEGGGLGDKICFLPAFVYVAKNCGNILGRIWVPDFMVELFKNIMDQTGNPEWKVFPSERFSQLWERDTFVRGRGLKDAYGHENIQYISGAGMHLVWVGFSDVLCKLPPPPGADVMPTIDFSKWWDQPNHPFAFNTANKYVVFTTGAVWRSRDVPGEYWNPIIEHVKSKGLTPVFLGARKIPVPANKSTINVKFSDRCNYGEGIDLRDKTTIMEAAWIMKNAACVVGLDNGLIQLASLTDANIVCAYNVVDPVDRRPNRTAGRWREIFLTKEELSCSGCMTNWPLTAPPHDFKSCLYQDTKCIHMLFQNQAERFTRAIDEILA